MKGETIPALQEFTQKQNPVVTVSYISNLLQNQDGANLYYLRSKAYFDLRAYQKAELDIETALNKIPGDIDFLILSAQIKAKLGMLDEALEDSKLVESSGLSSAKLYLLLAELYSRKGEKRLALSYINQIRKMGTPQSEKLYFDFLSRQIRSDSLGALESLSLNRIEHPNLSHAFFSFQVGRMGNIQYQKYILAEIKKYPLDPYLMMSWGDFLVHVGQFVQAEKVYAQVIDWLPRNSAIRIRVARFYVGRKKFDIADKYLDEVSTTSSEVRDALYLRALIRLNSGQKQRSIALLDSVRHIYAFDARFSNLFDRLVGKKIDSTHAKVDSTQLIQP